MHYNNIEHKNCGLALGYGKRIVPGNDISRNISFRRTLIEMLAANENFDADAVVPIPHAGVFLARSWIKFHPESLWLAFGAKKFHNSMFHVLTQPERDKHAREKVGRIRKSGTFHSVFLLDEAIVSGTTMRTAIRVLRTHGVECIFVRTLLPPISNICKHGILADLRRSDINQFLLDNKNLNYIADFLDADNYASLSIENIHSNSKFKDICLSCASGFLNYSSNTIIMEAKLHE